MPVKNGSSVVIGVDATGKPILDEKTSETIVGDGHGAGAAGGYGGFVDKIQGGDDENWLERLSKMDRRASVRWH